MHSADDVEFCQRNFGPVKNWSGGPKFQEKWSARTISPRKNLVRTWNNGSSMSTMFDHHCRLLKRIQFSAEGSQ